MESPPRYEESVRRSGVIQQMDIDQARQKKLDEIYKNFREKVITQLEVLLEDINTDVTSTIKNIECDETLDTLEYLCKRFNGENITDIFISVRKENTVSILSRKINWDMFLPPPDS